MILFSNQIQAQDSLATIYFYKHGKLTVAGYDIKNGDAVIGRIKATVLTHRTKPSIRFFTTDTESEASICLNLEAGRTYFVECGVEGGGAAASTLDHPTNNP